MDRITMFYIDRFKSLCEFNIPFSTSPDTNFLCLIGKNGAGKSTILQAIDFAGQIFRGDISSWLRSRGWERRHLISQKNMRNITLHIEGFFGDKKIVWKSSFSTTHLKCSNEKIYINDEEVLSLSNDSYSINKGPAEKNFVKYEGSFLSIIKDSFLQKVELLDFVNFMKKVYSFDTLNSRQLRSRARPVGPDGNIGRGGELLSGLIASFKQGEIEKLLNTTKDFYPWIESIYPDTLRGGWKELYFVESNNGSFYRNFPSLHECDGVLRLVGILSELMTSDTFIVFDEIENGFNPEIMEKLVHALVQSRKQIIVTTHNPVVLNYIDENVAKDGVLLVYRKNIGNTNIIRFFDLPEASEKLSYLGPGEVFLDTDINETLKNNGLL